MRIQESDIRFVGCRECSECGREHKLTVAIIRQGRLVIFCDCHNPPLPIFGVTVADGPESSDPVAEARSIGFKN